MYLDEITDELKAISKEYEKLFGYDPDGEISFEFEEESYDFYLNVLRECVKDHKDIFEVLEHMDGSLVTL